jgi:hypothetical protein
MKLLVQLIYANKKIKRKKFCYFFYLFFFETVSSYVAQDGLELEILLPLPPRYWDSRCAPLHLAVSY